MKVNEGITSGVMIDERNRCLCKRMKDGLVEMALHLVSPNTDLGPLDATGNRHGLGEIIALFVEKITTDLGDLIPTIERSGLIIDTPDIDAHIADRRQSVPTQVERREQLMLGMMNGYLQDGIARYLKYLRTVMSYDAVGYNQRQNIKVTFH